MSNGVDRYGFHKLIAYINQRRNIHAGKQFLAIGIVYLYMYGNGFTVVLKRLVDAVNLSRNGFLTHVGKGYFYLLPCFYFGKIFLKYLYIALYLRIIRNFHQRGLHVGITSRFDVDFANHTVNGGNDGNLRNEFSYCRRLRVYIQLAPVGFQALLIVLCLFRIWT